LEAALQKIITECAAKTDVSRFSEPTARAEKRFSETGTIEDESAVVIAQLVAQEAGRRVAGMAFARSSGFLVGMEWSEFKRLNPKWLDAVCKIRQVERELRKESLGKILLEVRQQLGPEFDVEDDPRVKRARREMEASQESIPRFARGMDEERFWRGIINRFLS